VKYTLNHVLQVVYELKAVVSHEGITVNTGHYVTFVKVSFTKWIYVDDAKVCFLCSYT